MSESAVYIVYATAPDEESAARIAKTVVEEQLAACANIVPRIRSIYRWQGKVEDEPESLIFFKTAGDRVTDLLARIKTLHTYDVPDIVAFPIGDGHPPYLDWVLENSRDIP